METKPNTVELTPETAAADIRILIEPLGDIDAIDTLSAAGVIDGNLADSMIYTARELRDRLSTCRDVVVCSLPRIADVQEHYNSMRGRFVPQSRYLCDLAEAYSLCDQQTIIVTYYSERPSRAPHYLTARAPHTRRLGELLAELAAAAAWTERGITGAVATATAGRDPEQLREMVDAVRSAAEKAIE